MAQTPQYSTGFNSGVETLKTNLDKRPSVHDVHKKGVLKSLPEGYVDRAKVVAE